MADINQEARIPVYINDEQAKSALKNLTSEAEKWRKKMFEAMAGGDLKGLKEAERELKKVNGQMNSIKKEAFDVNKVLQNISNASSKDLKKALAAVNKEMEGLNRSSKEYQALMSKKTAIKEEFAKINGVVKEQESFFGKLANGANKYFNIIALGIATLTGIAFSVGQFIKGMVGLDDALADVMKTTDLTRKEVREMYQEFKYLNTRTPRAELLALAEEAGRLGRKGKKDIMDFVEVANKIKISLGDDLGGDAEKAIKEVGKLTEIYRIGIQYGTDFKTSMEKVGSGLNEVANNSNASAEYMIEYLKRLGGISTQAKITAADIMGYGSTFDQLGQNVEMAATAQSKVIIDMFTDPAKYARIAKMEVSEFSKLLKTDANEAFIQFLEGLNGNNQGLSEMATKLDGLGIDGARAVQALASLSSNTKMLRDQQILANDSMREGTSLQNEYAIKNNNLAGSWEKLTVFINSKFINSNFISFLERVIGKTAEWIALPLSKKLREEQIEVNGLVVQLQSANLKEEERAEILKKLNELAPDVAKTILDEKSNIESLTEALSKYNDEQALKILIAEGDEDIARQKAKVESYKSLSLEAGAALAKEMKSSLDWFGKQGPQVRKEAESILYDTQKSLLQKGEQLNSLALKVTRLGNSSLFQSLDAYNIFKKGYSENLFDLNLLITKTKATTDQWTAIFGGNKPGATPPPPPPPPPGPPGTDKKTMKEASDKALAVLDEANNDRMARLIIQYEKEAWSDERFKAEQMSAELAYLTLKKALLEQYGQSTIQTEAQISQKRVEMQKTLNGVLLEGDKELMKQLEDGAKIDGKAILATIDAADKTINALDKLKDKEQQILEQRQEAYMQFAVAVGQSFGNLMQDQEATFGDYLKNTILMALDAFHQWFLIEKMKAIIQGISGGNPVSIAVAIAKVAAMEIAYQGVRAVVSNSGNKADSKGFSEGGPTGGSNPRKVAGVVHEDEYVIPAEGYNAPGIRPFVDLMEIARRNGSLARLDLRPVMAMYTGSGKNGYSSGGSTSASTRSSGTSFPERAAVEGRDPELIKAITRLNSNLEKGIRASINKYGVNGLDEGIRDINKFNSKVNKP